MKIEGSIVAITGGGGGLGAAMAHRLARQGARLALIDFRTDELDKLREELAMPEKDCLVVLLIAPHHRPPVPCRTMERLLQGL